VSGCTTVRLVPHAAWPHTHGAEHQQASRSSAAALHACMYKLGCRAHLAVLFGWCIWAFLWVNVLGVGSAVVHGGCLVSSCWLGPLVTCYHPHECCVFATAMAACWTCTAVATSMLPLPAHACQAVRPGSTCNDFNVLTSFPALPLRPVCSDITERQRRLAEIIEMIHTASLVHDDVLDDCSVRRGAPLQLQCC
jgi:hypothetical protein